MTTTNSGPEVKAAEEISKHKLDLMPLLMPTCQEDKQTALREIESIITKTNAEYYLPLLHSCCTFCKLVATCITRDGCNIGVEIDRLEAAWREEGEV